MASQDELDDFLSRYPCDEDAQNYILNSEPDVQMAVLQGFKPKQEGEADYSALVISFTKKQRQNRPSAPPMRPTFQGAGPIRRTAAIPPPQERRSSAGIDLEAFFDRYPCDEDARNYVVSSAPHVQQEIVRSFRPQREGESDYSAILITYAKRCRSGAPPSRPSAGVTAGEYEAFRDRYPFDDDTANYLQKASPEVLKYVMENFKPPVEGEADYSALLITYCKRCKSNPAVAGPAPQTAYGFPAMPIRSGIAAMPIRSSTGNGGYGKGGFASPLPQTPRYQPMHSTGKGQGSFGGRPAGGFNGNDRALQDFRRRIPMDDRAFAYLQESSAAVQREVLETFAPQREDSDYSALVIGFTKRCRTRHDQGGAGMSMPPMKRPRVGY